MRKTRKLFNTMMAVIITSIVFVGCTNSQTSMKDREGTEFKVPSKVEKIVSTAPSNTEVLVALGVSDKIVATDKYSTDVQGLKADLPQLDFRNPDAEAIVALKPDIIIASGHNKAGAEDPFKAVKEAGIPVAYIPSSTSFDGIYGDIEFIAQLTGTQSKGKEIIDSMKSEISKIKEIGDKIKDKKSVYFEISSGSKLSSFGKNTFLNEMIETIGAKNIFANQESWISPSEESVITANPDVILTNEGYLDNPINAIKTRPGWDNINAVKNNQVFLLDKNTTSRPSQNIIKALKEMAKAVYPNEYASI